MAKAPNVANLGDYRPRVTAQHLIQEARNASTGPGEDLAVALPEMAGFMTYLLELVLSECDYHQDPTSNTAKAARGLAAFADYFETHAGGAQ